MNQLCGAEWCGIRVSVTFVLYKTTIGGPGSWIVAVGWGFSNATFHAPGPPIVVLYNTNVTLTLIPHDSAPHNWFIDYNNDLTMSPGEPSSKDFNVPGDVVGTLTFVASQTGN